MRTVPDIQPLVISAPFGNYIQPAGCTATLGTFTAAPRPGRVWRILRTVRYYPRLRAWVNRIGLRNPGIDWLVERVAAGRMTVADKLISIHGFEAADWWTLLEKTAPLQPAGIELNMSCPNVGEMNWPADLFGRAAGTGVPIVVKLPPVHYALLFEQATEAGLRCFHCCNTLPIPAGGMSGKPLQPVALECIHELRDHRAPRIDAGLVEELRIIAGGGITEPADITAYAEAGAWRFAVGTKVFHPKYLFSHRGLKPLIEAAGQATGGD